MTLHGDGERSGSALFPPRFSDWSAEEYLDWWQNVPLDEDVLSNTQHAHEQLMAQWSYDHCTQAVDTWKASNPDPTGPNAPYVRDGITAIAEWERGVDRAWNTAEEEFFSARSPHIPDVVLRHVYRGYKMHSYSSHLPEHEQHKVDEHVMPVGEDGMTVQQISERYQLHRIDDATRTKRTDALLSQLTNALAHIQR